MGMLPPAARRFATFWPPAHAFETMQTMMHGATVLHGFARWLILLAAVIMCIASGALMV
jgi:hypothetical protein